MYICNVGDFSSGHQLVAGTSSVIRDGQLITAQLRGTVVVDPSDGTSLLLNGIAATDEGGVVLFIMRMSSTAAATGNFTALEGTNVNGGTSGDWLLARSISQGFVLA